MIGGKRLPIDITVFDVQKPRCFTLFGVEKHSTSDGLVGVAMVHIDIKQRGQGRQ